MPIGKKHDSISSIAERRRRVKLRRFWREWLRPIIPVVIIVLAARSSIADWNDVPTGSMKPTILEGDRIFVNRMAYDLKIPFTQWSVWEFDGPKRGDIIVFFSPNNGTRVVKRVIGLPGETVRLWNNQLRINGRPVSRMPIHLDRSMALELDESSFIHAYREDLPGRQHPILIDRSPYTKARRTYGPITLGEDEYFVMGDNRDHSGDSREFGVVHRSRIAGEATRVLLSVQQETWDFRWSRSFQPLE